MIRSYTELRRIPTIHERFDYLSLQGQVGDVTFGYDRWMNQQFYTSSQWRDVRYFVLDRDRGCDLGVLGFEIHRRPVIHHMNPMQVRDLVDGDPSVLDPEFLITCSHQTHNAIHYGDRKQLPKEYSPRKAGDTKLW